MLYKMHADYRGVSATRKAVRFFRNALATHPCERALQVLADLVTAILDGETTWDAAEKLIDSLNWQQNGN